MKQRPKETKGKSTDAWQDVMVIRRSRNRMRTFSIKNTDPDTTGYELLYRFALYTSSGIDPDYDASSAGAQLIAGAIHRKNYDFAYDKIIVQVKSETAGEHNFFQVGYSDRSV